MAQSGVQPLPGTVDAPHPEVVMNGLPGRKVVGQKAPSTPTADDVEDGVKDLAWEVQAWPTVGLWSGKVGL